MATRVTRLLFDGDYTDSDGNNNLAAGGSGNSFDTSIKHSGTSSLKTNSSGYADKATFAAITTGNADRSMGGWMYVPSSSSFGSPAILALGPASTRQAWQLRSNTSTQVLVDLYADQVSFTTPARSLDAWYHYWTTYVTATTSRFYQDTVESVSGGQNHVGTSNLTAGKFNVSRDFDNFITTAAYFDDLQVWNGATSAGELAGIYASGKKGVAIMLTLEARKGVHISPLMYRGLWGYNQHSFDRFSTESLMRMRMYG